MTKSRLRPCGAGTGSLYVPLKETVCGTLLLWWTSRSFWQIICQDNSGIEVLRCSTDRLRGVTLVRSPILVMSALKQTRHKKLKVHAMVIKWQGLLLVAVLLRCHPSSERLIFFSVQMTADEPKKTSIIFNQSSQWMWCIFSKKTSKNICIILHQYWTFESSYLDDDLD